MRQLSREGYACAREFLAQQGRPLDRALGVWAFDGGDARDVVHALGEYKNADGGFGRALEPDVRTPSSSALATSIALSLLIDLGVGADSEIVLRTIAYLTQTLEPSALVWRIVPTDVNGYPHAPWWNDEDGSLAKSFGDFQVNPRAELVAGLWSYAALVPPEWLATLTESTVAAIQARELDAHDLICAVKLAEAASVPDEYRRHMRPVVIRRAQELVARDVARWREYNPQPLWFVSASRSPLAEPFADILPANLDFLVDTQTAEGYWEPSWSWFGAYPETWPQALQDARSLLTLKALRQLKAFGRIEE